MKCQPVRVSQLCGCQGWSEELSMGPSEEAGRPREIRNNIQIQASRGHWLGWGSRGQAGRTGPWELPESYSALG